MIILSTLRIQAFFLNHIKRTFFRELHLIVDPNVALMSVEHYSATLVSHELAHKWFGNYITCYWWSNTWINEGYASYFGYMATHQVNMSRVQILKKNIHKYLVLNNSTIYLIRYFPNMNCTITSIPATFKHHWRLTLAPVLFLSITM